MITKGHDKELTKMFWMLRDNPGWLSHCKDAGYSQKELVYLEHLSDVNLEVDRKMDKWDREIDKSINTDIYLLKTADEKISVLSGLLEEAWNAIKRIREAGGGFIEREMVFLIFKIGRIEKLRRSLRANQCHQPSLKPDYEKITDADIVRAREHPIENLIQAGPDGKVLCVFHDDTKPSATIKGGFYYCYVCHAWCDSIKWKMQVDKMSFVEAVKFLR